VPLIKEMSGDKAGWHTDFLLGGQGCRDVFRPGAKGL
jgi:hypothetical protein